MKPHASKVILATRKSPLALRQAELVADALRKSLETEADFLPMTTTGDRQLSWSLEQRGGKGLFTKELEVALLEGKSDLAVHSAKDLPTEMPDGLSIVGFLPREDPRDVLILREDVETPETLATGSPRRRAQLAERFPDVRWSELRGNVGTRLRKIAEDREADGTVLAAAGLKRLGIDGFPGLRFEALAVTDMVPAPGQAAIALQAREEDASRFLRVCDAPTGEAVRLERAVLESMGGGCHVAIGAHASNGELLLFKECGKTRSVSLLAQSSPEENVAKALRAFQES